MVNAAVLAGGLDGDDVLDVFDNTNDFGVPARVKTNVATLAVGDVVTDVALANGFFEVSDGVDEGGDGFFVAAEEVQDEAKGGFFADAR